MTTWNESGKDKWYSVYVPHGAGTVSTNESYFRLGSPDVTAEAVFLNALKTSYADAAAQPAVQAAFGNTPSGGIVFYTEGDLVQFINGRSDTRVLNDSFIVHVLDKQDVDAAKAVTSQTTTAVPTYRTYLRLGKPHNEIEKPLGGSIAAGDTEAYVVALAPADPALLDAATTATDSSAVLAGDANAGTSLSTAASNGDRKALDALEALRTSTDAKATGTPYGGSSSVNAWALATLQGLELKFANNLRDRALTGDTTSRDTLKTRAAAGDPVVRRKLVELAQSQNPAATQSFNSQTPARTWATTVLAQLPPGDELTARWSLGGGVALFSDQPITITTPNTMKVTVGSDSRSVLGPTYSETYDVDDATIQKIKDGWITQADQIPSKSLVTASLTQRSTPFWRTTKFDQSKSLSYTVTDSGSFSLSSSYAFGVGLKITNGLSASFDASVGVSASVPLAFKVELNDQRTETTWTGGKCDFKDTQDLRGRALSLTTDLAQTALQPSFKVFTKIVRGSMLVVNAAAAAYTAAVIAIGNTTTQDSSGPTANIRQILEKGEAVYIAATALNAVFLAASLVAGVIQLTSKLAADAATKLLPVQPPNVVINGEGIKLQCGASFISMDPTGIAISAPQVYVAAPFTTVLPAYLTGNLTPAGIAEAVALAGEGVLVMDLFGELLV